MQDITTLREQEVALNTLRDKALVERITALAQYKEAKKLGDTDFNFPAALITMHLEAQELIQRSHPQHRNHFILLNQMINLRTDQIKRAKEGKGDVVLSEQVLHQTVYEAMENVNNNKDGAKEKLVGFLKETCPFLENEQAIDEKLAPVFQLWSWNKPDAKKVFARILEDNGVSIHGRTMERA